MIWPLVSSCAMPRPATMRINVATMGWTPQTATSAPLPAPATAAASSAITRASANDPPMSMCDSTEYSGRATRPAAIAPAIAMTAPTDRSIPPVAMTSVMATATSIRGAARSRMSIRLP